METQLNYRMQDGVRWATGACWSCPWPQGVIPLARRTALLAALGGTQLSEHWHLLIGEMLQPVPDSTYLGYLSHLQWQTWQRTQRRPESGWHQIPERWSLHSLFYHVSQQICVQIPNTSKEHWALSLERELSTKTGVHLSRLDIYNIVISNLATPSSFYRRW